MADVPSTERIQQLHLTMQKLVFLPKLVVHIPIKILKQYNLYNIKLYVLYKRLLNQIKLYAVMTVLNFLKSRLSYMILLATKDIFISEINEKENHHVEAHSTLHSVSLCNIKSLKCNVLQIIFLKLDVFIFKDA